ncbi:MAG: antitoxin [Burkholderiales bacterium]|nr:MAG: antitoxin [Burkholderiales bacterium]
MSVASVFINNRTQAVRLPADMRLPDEVKRVHIRAVGRERVIAPLDGAWDSFFLNAATVSEDFLSERASQQQSERESF